MKCVVWSLLLIGFSLEAYHLPAVLSLDSFFMGGPLRPKVGLYWQQYNVLYNAYKFTDERGSILENDASLRFRALVSSTQAIVVSPLRLLKANVGFTSALPLVLSSHVSANRVGLTSEGGGWGDLVLGVFLQWKALRWKDKHFFVNRIEFDTFFPTGFNENRPQTLYPANGFFCFDPYWAATFFFTERFSASWRINYLWCLASRHTKRKAGNAVHLNYTLEFKINPRWYVGINGYFLQQLSETTIEGVPLANTKERVFSIGPGFLYAFGNGFDSVCIGNVFIEAFARNRPQGVRFNIRLIKYFN